MTREVILRTQGAGLRSWLCSRLCSRRGFASAFFFGEGGQQRIHFLCKQFMTVNTWGCYQILPPSCFLLVLPHYCSSPAALAVPVPPCRCVGPRAVPGCQTPWVTWRGWGG